MAEQHEVSQATKELIGTTMTYLKQRGAEFVTGVVVEPLQRAAGKIVMLLLAATLGIIAMVFLSNFIVLGLADLFGSLVWGYLGATVVILIIAVILLKIMSSGGKAEERGKHGQRRNGDRGGH